MTCPMRIIQGAKGSQNEAPAGRCDRGPKARSQAPHKTRPIPGAEAARLCLFCCAATKGKASARNATRPREITKPCACWAEYAER